MLKLILRIIGVKVIYNCLNIMHFLRDLTYFSNARLNSSFSASSQVNIYTGFNMIISCTSTIYTTAHFLPFSKICASVLLSLPTFLFSVSMFANFFFKTLSIDIRNGNIDNEPALWVQLASYNKAINCNLLTSYQPLHK